MINLRNLPLDHLDTGRYVEAKDTVE